MAVPTAFSLEDRKLWKPLADKVEITDKTGASDDPRQLGFKFELELDHATRIHDPRQRNANDGEVILIAVVWSHELHRREEVAAVVENQARDPSPSPIPAAFSPVAKGPPLELAHERGLRAGKSVEVEVKVKLVGRGVRAVGPADRLDTFEAMGFGVEGHLNLVIHDFDIGRWCGGPQAAGHREGDQE